MNVLSLFSRSSVLVHARRAFHAGVVAALTVFSLGVARAQVSNPAGYNFGSVALGQSASATVTFNFTGAVTVGSVSVVTQGATGKDFQPLSSTLNAVNCRPQNYNNGGFCTVDVVFAPLGPGARNGAAVLRNSSNQVLAVGYVTGYGTGAQLGFSAPTVSTFAGKGVAVLTSPVGLSGTSTGFLVPFRMTFDALGNLYMADFYANSIYKITPAGLVSSVIGQYRATCGSNYTCGYPTSNSTTLAVNSSLYLPYSIVVDGAGLLWFVDDSVAGLATVDLATGYVTAQIPGNGNAAGAPHTSGNIHNLGISSLGSLQAIATDGLGNMYVSCFFDGTSTTEYGMIAKLDPAGNITIVAGNTTPVSGHSAPADGTVATAAPLGGPSSMAFDGAGNLYFFDAAFNQVFKLDTAGKVHPFAGSGSIATDNTSGLPYWQSGTASTTANTAVNFAKNVGAIAVDASGNVYVPSAPTGPFDSTSLASRVFVFTQSGYAYALAGTTIGEVNGPATSAQLAAPTSVAISPAGDVYIGENNVRRDQNSPAVYIGSSIRKWSMGAQPITFAQQAKGTTSAGQTVTATNLGNAPLVLTTPATGTTNPLADPGFTVLSNSAGNACVTGSSTPLAVGSSCTAVVAFQPHVSSAPVSGNLTYTGNIPSSTVVPLSGTSSAGIVSLALSGLPATASPGGSNTVTVTAQGSSNATFTGYTGTVHFSLSPADVAASLPSDYTFNGSENGVKTFSVALSAVGAHTLTVTDAANSVSGNQSTTVATAVDHLAFTAAPPTTTAAGTSFNVTVTAYSNSGTTVATNYTGPVSFTSTDSSAVFPTTLSMTNGVGTFAITLKTAGTQTVTVSDAGGTPTLTSSGISVTAGVAAALTAASGTPQTANTGTPFATALQVKVLDAYANPVAGTVVSFAAPSSGASATLNAPTCTTASNGLCSVTATGNSTGGTYAIGASAGSLTASFALTNYSGPQAAGVFGGNYTPAFNPAYTYTSIFNAQLNASHNIILGDQTDGTDTSFRVHLLTGSTYINAAPANLTLYSTNFGGVGIDTSGNINYCYYNRGAERINARSPNGSSGTYTPTYNVYTLAASGSARCTTGVDGTVYLAPADGTLQTAVPGSGTYTVTTVTGAPVGVTNAVLGYNGALLLATTSGTYVGTITNGAWTGSLVTARSFYNYAAYQDATGKIYLEDASTQAGFQYTPGSTSYTESAWTKPFGVTANAYSMNTAGSLLVASPTAVQLQFSTALIFPASSVGTADPVEELVFKFTAGGTLGSTTVASTNGTTDFVDAGTGTCTTNGSAHTYAVGDLCTVDVTFTPTRGGTRTGTVTLNSASNAVMATASLTGTGIGQTVDHLAFTTVPTRTPKGVRFAVTVTAYTDAGGSTVATFVNSVAATVTSSDSAATLPSGTTFTNGVATFNVTLNTGGSNTITVADPADSLSVTSASITATTVDHFVLSGLPASTTAGVQISGTITAYSDSGTTVATNYTGPVAVTSSDSSATLPINFSLTNGTANFNVTLKTAPTATITVADAGGSPSITSGSITVAAATAAAVVASSGSGQSAIITNAFANPLLVQTVDAYSNPVGGQTVSLVIPTNGAGLQGGTYQCTTSASATPTGSCSISVTANGTAGSYTVLAQSGSLTTASFSLTNNAKTSQTITFAGPGAQTFGTTPTLSASSTSSLAVTFTSTTTGVCTVTGSGSLTFVTAGTCSISADQAGNSTYAAAATLSRSFTVNAVAPDAPTIGTATGSNTQATVAFTAPANTGGAAITGYTVTSSPGAFTATGSGSPITMPGLTNGTPYTFTVTAMNTAGTGNPTAASNSVTPNGTQTITFANPGTQTYGTAPTISASASSGLAVVFSSTTPAVCSVSGFTLTFSATGTCTVNADQAASAAYSAATRVTQSFSVQAASQTIAFNVISPIVYSVGGTVTLTATGGASGNAVTFSVISGPGTVSGTTLTITGAGTIVVAADQPGNSSYNAATQAQNSIVVTATSQTITFSQPSSPITYAPGATVALTATSTSGLTPAFSVISGPGTIAGSTLTITGAGIIVVGADQPGSTNYNAATQVQRSVVVNTASQTITFTQPASPIAYGSVTTVALGATGGAGGNAVTFSVASGPGTINGSTLTITGAGTVVINADQAGSANYAAATTVQKSVAVSKAVATLSGPTAQPVFVVYNQAGTLPVSIAGQYTGAGITAPGGVISYTITNAANTSVATGTSTIASGAVNVPVANTLAPGNYTVTASYAGDGNYTAATPVTVQLQVGQIQPVITWTSPSALTYGASLTAVLNAQALNGTTAVAGSYTYLNGASAVTAATVLPAGSYVLTVNFTPSDTATYKTATATATLVVNKATPAIMLAPSVSSVLVTNPVTLTATVASAVSTPTGTVTFLDGSASLGTGTLTNGVATLTTGSLAVGTHSITAVYAGDANFIAQTAPATNVQVNDFNLTISTTTTAGSSTTQTVLPGGQAVYNFTISPTGAATFPAAVNLTVSGLPTGATYTISPQIIAAGAGATNVTLTINVPKQTAMLQRGETLAPLALALLVLPFSGRIRRRAGRLGRLAAMLLLLIGGAASVATLTGCGSTTGVFASPQTTYNVTITGTSGTLTHSTTVTLTVQ